MYAPPGVALLQQDTAWCAWCCFFWRFCLRDISLSCYQAAFLGENVPNVLLVHFNDIFNDLVIEGTLVIIYFLIWSKIICSGIIVVCICNYVLIIHADQVFDVILTPFS